MALLIGACSQQPVAIRDSHSFLAALRIHLDAIKTSDLGKLRPTIAEEVSMIGPDGKKYDSKKSFMKFHEDWFALDNWEWDGKIVKTASSDSLGYALIQYQFIQKDSEDNILFQDHEYLILIFKKLTQGWQLVHDQNTSIQELNK